MKKDGKPTGLQDAGSYFHTDYSYLQVPARATTLYSRVVPRAGGDTLFADQQAAYDDLPEAMKQRIEEAGLPYDGTYRPRRPEDADDRRAAAVRPVPVLEATTQKCSNGCDDHALADRPPALSGHRQERELVRTWIFAALNSVEPRS